MNTKNMKKTILISIFILTLIVLLMINTMSLLATNPSDFDFDSSTGTITGYRGDGGEIIIPDEIDGVQVKRIEGYIFDNANLTRYVTKVILPEYLEYLGDNAFCMHNDFGSAESVLYNADIVFKYGTTKITGNEAFYDSSITVHIPPTVTEIWESVFYGSTIKKFHVRGGSYAETWISNSDIYKGTPWWDDYFDFDFNTGTINGQTYDPDWFINNAVIPDEIFGVTVRNIGFSAFKDYGLFEIKLPATIETINGYAFMSNNITNLYLPEGLTDIDYNAFAHNNIESLVLPSTLQYLGTCAFYDNNISHLEIKGITNIEHEVFRENDLIELVISDGVNYIGEYSFSSNINLTTLTLTNSLSYVESNAFSDCPLLSTVHCEKDSYAEEWALYNGYTIKYIDYIPPVITIEPYINTPTNQDIIVNATTNEGTLNSTSHTFTENGAFTFIATDEAGNIALKTVEITNIDKSSPIINVERDIEETVFTNQVYNLNVTFTDNEANKDLGIKEITLSDGRVSTFDLEDNIKSKTETISISKNGDYIFTVEDLAGNVVTEIVNVSNIDKKDPEVTVMIDPDGPTNKDVIIDIMAIDENGIAYIENIETTEIVNDSSYSTTVSSNGTYSFKICDKAGNIVIEEVIIDNINKVGPVISVDPYNTNPTSDNVEVFLRVSNGYFVDEDLNIIFEDENMTIRYTFAENGSKEFTAKDIYGNESTKTITINHIDKENPTIEYTREKEDTEKTNKEYDINFEISDVGIAGIKEILTPDPDKNITFEIPQMFHLFNYTVFENGTYEFKVIDFAGNESYISIPVNNINSIPPTISITKSIETVTNQDVVVTAIAKDALGNDITSKLNETEFIFISNGSFEFVVVDDWGNTSSEIVVIDNIDLIPPEAPIASANKTFPTNTEVIITSVFSEDSVVKEYSLDEEIWFNYIDGVVVSENGSVMFRGQDEAGNYSDLTTYIVDNIDLTPPSLEIVFDDNEWYKSTFNIVLAVNDNVADKHNLGLFKLVSLNDNNLEDELEVFEDSPLTYSNIEFEISSKGEYTFRLYDVAGNITEKTIEVEKYDTLAPSATYTLNPDVLINKDVEITITATDAEADDINASSGIKHIKSLNINDEFMLSEEEIVESNIAKFIVAENGVYEFEIMDHAGNKSELTVEVTNINKIPPIISIDDYIKIPTNQDITVTLRADKGEFQPIEGLVFNSDGSVSYTFTEDDTVTFTVIDAWGNITKETIEITNIYREPPIISATRLVEEWTKNSYDIKVEFSKKDIGADLKELVLPNGEKVSIDTENNYNHTVSKNGTYKFIVSDVAGNSSEVTVTVSNIDMLLPNATLTQDNYDFTNKDVEITVSAIDTEATEEFGMSGIKQIKNSNVDNVNMITKTEIVLADVAKFKVAENGTYSFEVMDNAGNTQVFSITIENINKIKPVITLTPIDTTLINKDYTVYLKADKGEFQPFEGAVISEDKLSIEYTFKLNGSQTFEVIDKWGNKSEQTVTINHIDKVLPTIEITPSTPSWTNKAYDLEVVFKDESGAYNSGIREVIMPDGSKPTLTDGQKSFSINYPVSNNGYYNFKVLDVAGNEFNVTYEVKNINYTPPTIVIEPYSTFPTNQDVTITAKAFDVETTDITQEMVTSSYTFTQNGAFTFEVTDKWGNKTEVEVIIEHIDKTKVDIIAKQQIESWTNQDYDIIVNFKDETPNVFNSGIKVIILPNGSTIDVNGNLRHDINYLVTENGTYTFKVEDIAGNKSELTVEVANINKIPPVISVSNYQTTLTNKDIEVELLLDQGKFVTSNGEGISGDNIYVTNNGLRAVYVFTENGTKEFKARDKWGNESIEIITIDNINKELPVITIEPYTTELTDQDIIVRASVNKGVLNATEYTFTKNGAFTFVAVDAWGNTSLKTIVINNIDKEPPIITISNYPKAITNQSITVYANANKGSLNATSYTFIENGEFTFVVTDSLGRTDSKTVVITNIDKTPPIITINDYQKTPTNKNITVTASVNEGVLNATSYIFTENGEFTFIATDEAGNISQRKVVINNIQKDTPVITVEDYITTFTNQNIEVVATTNKGKFVEIDVNNADIITHRDDKVVLSFKENDTAILTVRDDAGNETKRTINIDNINKIAPTITLSEIPTEVVNRDIVVTATAKDAFGSDLTGSLNFTSYTFKENGICTFEVTDKWGNITIKTVVIENINRIAPKITIEEYSKIPTNQDVIIKATVDKGSLNFSQWTFTDNGSFTFEAEDEAGNKSFETVTISHIDRVAPTFRVTKDPEEKTNKDVRLTIVALDDNGISYIKRDIDQRPIMGGKYEVNVLENGVYTFIAGDIAGNEATIDVTVGNIDKTPPVITILPYNKESTNQDVAVTAQTNEGTFVNGENTETYIFETNGAYTFIATDEVGNISQVTVVIENIDKEFAVVTIQPYNTAPTNKDVIVSAISDNGFFSNGQKTQTYVFKENGTYTFVATTLSGLKTEKTVTIDNINKIPPVISITGLEDTTLTTKNVIVYATAIDINGDSVSLNSLTYTFEENGEFTFIATDKWGNKAEQTVTVNHINKEPPIITIEPYNTSLTNQNVTVKATVNKGFLEVDSYTFMENGEFTFVAYDDLGNKSTRKVIVSNIDKTPPIITINDYITEPTNKNITVTATVNEGTLEQNSYTFTENGIFTFRAIDDAGNISEKTVSITNIVKVLPKITILPYKTELTNNPIPVTAITDFGLFQNGETTETYIFNTNGSYTFRVTDEFGTVVTETVTITNINRVLPVITITIDTDDPSALSVTVTARTDKGVFEGSKTNEEIHIFTENGSYTFVAIDDWGNKRVKTVVIDYIKNDSTPPIITVNPYTTQYTNQSILVTVRTDKGTLNSSSHLFEENGAFTFIAEDQWGNKTLKTVTIENIDKTPPNAPKFETYLNEFGQVQILVSSNGDNLSGVAKVYTKVTGENWIDKKNNYDKLPDGTYTVSAKVEDNVGNVSEIFDFVFNNQNNKVKQLYTEINSVIEKITTTNLSFMKELRDDINNKVNSMETSSQKEFLSQNLAKLNAKIASMDGTKEEEIKTTEDKVRDLFKELKKYPTNQTIISEINRLIGSITNKSKRDALIAEMNDIINGVKEPDNNDGGNSGEGDNNDDDDDKNPDDNNDGGNDDNDGDNEDPPPNSNPDFWDELQKRQEEEQRRREEQERRKNDYSNVNEAELEKQKKLEEEKQKQDQEIKNYASSLTSNTGSGIATSNGSFILREKDSKTTYIGSSANVQLDSKLFEAFNYKNEKNIVIPITRTINNLRVALTSIDFDKVNKKDLTVSIIQNDIELLVPLQKLNIGFKTFEIKVNKEDKNGYEDNKIKSDIFDISIVSGSNKVYRSQLSNFYNSPIELRLSYDSNFSNNIGVFFFNESSKVWEKVSSTNNQSSKEFIVKNPEFGKYAIREMGGSISVSNKDIEYLDKNGIFEGINISGLSTDSSVSKGIMISMIINLLDLNGNVYDSFTDIPKTNPYYKNISLAQQYGIITQYGGSFGVENNTTEDEAIEFLVNASTVYLKKVKPITKEELYSKINKDNRLTFAEASAMISYIMKNK